MLFHHKLNRVDCNYTFKTVIREQWDHAYESYPIVPLSSQLEAMKAKTEMEKKTM